MSDADKPSPSVRAYDELRERIKDMHTDTDFTEHYAEAFQTDAKTRELRMKYPIWHSISKAIEQPIGFTAVSTRGDGIVHLMSHLGDLYEVRLEDGVPVIILVARGTGEQVK